MKKLIIKIKLLYWNFVINFNKRVEKILKFSQLERLALILYIIFIFSCLLTLLSIFYSPNTIQDKQIVNNDLLTEINKSSNAYIYKLIEGEFKRAEIQNNNYIKWTTKIENKYYNLIFNSTNLYDKNIYFRNCSWYEDKIQECSSFTPANMLIAKSSDTFQLILFEDLESDKSDKVISNDDFELYLTHIDY